MAQTHAKLGIVTVGRKRPGFDQEWNRTMRAAAITAVEAAGLAIASGEQVIADERATREALARCENAGCNILLILQPSMGNGQLAMTIAQRWNGPIILWATPERPDGEKVSSCSLVGQHLWASIFRRLSRGFAFVYGHPDAPATRNALAAAAASATAGVAGAPALVPPSRIGLLGAHAPGFIAMDADPFALFSQFAAQLHRLSLPQFLDRVRAISESAIRADLDRVRALNLPMHGVTDADLPMNSRYYLALRDLIDEESLDAVSIQDWPELPQMLGQWPYLAMSRLTDEGQIVTMEGDVDGTFLGLAGQRAGAGFGFLTDWLEHDDQNIRFWHAGMAPLSWCTSPRLARHFNTDQPLVVDGSFRAGEPMTVARIWPCDGGYRGMAFEGLTIPDPRPLTGNTSLLRVSADVNPLFESLLHAGMPHHVALFRGHHRDRLQQLMRTMNVELFAPA